MIKIPLTQSKFAVIDERDYKVVTAYSWYYLKGYARTNIWKRPYRRAIYMHQLLKQVSANCEVDHRDGDGLNNRRRNLRAAKHVQNTRNRSKSSGKSSSYKGVSFCKRSQKWMAQICYNRSNHFLGYFKEELDAAKAYNRAAKKLYKSFAKLNML